MRTTNGIQHDLQVGDIVWSTTCTVGQVFEIVRFTEKRVVCKEVGELTSYSNLTIHNRNVSHSNHCPSSLFKVDQHNINNITA